MWFPSSCYVLKSHRRRDLTSAETKVDYLPLAKVLYEERNGFKPFGAANGSTLLSRSQTNESVLASLQKRRLTKLFELENS